MSLMPEQRRELAARIQALQAELEELAAQRESSTETVELDQTRQGRLSRIDALQGQAMAQAAVRRAAVQQRALARAAAALESEDFGLCSDCDEPIPFKRLWLDPCAQRCVACAEAAEH